MKPSRTSRAVRWTCILTGISFAFLAHAAPKPPLFTKVVGRDTDGNGRVDQIEVFFDQPVVIYDGNPPNQLGGIFGLLLGGLFGPPVPPPGNANDGLPCISIYGDDDVAARATIAPGDYSTGEDGADSVVLKLMERPVLSDTGARFRVVYEGGSDSCYIRAVDKLTPVPGLVSVEFRMQGETQTTTLQYVDLAGPAVSKAQYKTGSGLAGVGDNLPLGAGDRLVVTLSEKINPRSLGATPDVDFEFVKRDGVTPSQTSFDFSPVPGQTLHSSYAPFSAEQATQGTQLITILLPAGGPRPTVPSDTDADDRADPYWRTTDWLRLKATSGIRDLPSVAVNPKPDDITAVNPNNQDVVQGVDLNAAGALPGQLNQAAFQAATAGSPDPVVQTANQGTTQVIKGNTVVAGNQAVPIGDGNQLVTTVTEVVTLDLNGDGKVDCYRVIFNHKVKDFTFKGDRYNPDLSSATAPQFILVGNTWQGSEVPEMSGGPDVPNDNVLYIKIDVTQRNVATDQVGDFVVAEGFLMDRFANTVQQVKSADLVELDRAPPALLSVTTIDFNGNGKVDLLKLTWSEPVLDNSYDWTKQSCKEFKIAASSQPELPDGDQVDKDGIIHVPLLESTLYDSGKLPGSYKADEGLLKDKQGNSSRPANAAGALIRGMSVPQLADGVPPRLVAVVVNEASQIVDFEFCEPVWRGNPGAPAPGGSLTPADFFWRDADGRSIRSVKHTPGSPRGRITLSSPLTSEAVAEGTLEVQGTVGPGGSVQVVDMSGNKAVIERVGKGGVVGTDRSLDGKGAGGAAAGGCFVSSQAGGIALGLPQALAFSIGLAALLLARRRRVW